MGEAQTLLRQAVDVGRTNLASIAAYVGIAHVIAEDEDNIGSRRELSRGQDADEKKTVPGTGRKGVLIFHGRSYYHQDVPLQTALLPETAPTRQPLI